MALNEMTTHIMKSKQKQSISYQSCIGNIKVEKSAYKEQELTFWHRSAVALKTKKKTRISQLHWSGLSRCCYLFNGFPKCVCPFSHLRAIGHLKHTRGSKKIQSLKQLTEKKLMKFFSFSTLVMALIVYNTATGNILANIMI